MASDDNQAATNDADATEKRRGAYAGYVVVVA